MIDKKEPEVRLTAPPRAMARLSGLVVEGPRLTVPKMAFHAGLTCSDDCDCQETK